MVGGEELERRRGYKRLFTLQPFRGQGFDDVPSKFAYDKPPSGRCEDETKKGIYHDEDHIN